MDEGYLYSHHMLYPPCPFPPLVSTAAAAGVFPLSLSYYYTTSLSSDQLCSHDGLTSDKRHRGPGDFRRGSCSQRGAKSSVSFSNEELGFHG